MGTAEVSVLQVAIRMDYDLIIPHNNNGKAAISYSSLHATYVAKHFLSIIQANLRLKEEETEAQFLCPKI